MENNGMEKEDLVECDGKTMICAEGNGCWSRDPTKVETEHIMVLKTRGNQQSLFPNVCAMDNKIPKYIISLDEKYLVRCLEWVHATAFGANSSKISTKIGLISSSLNSVGLRYGSTLDMASLITECPFSASASPSGGCILGSITSSKSMINILTSPLLHRFGSLDPSWKNVSAKSIVDSKLATVPVLTSTPKKLKEMVLGDDDGHEDNSSSCSDQSSCSLSAAVSQGMLKCSWKDGFPNYVFSVDDRGEVYLANLIKIQSPNEKGLDYIYTFHLKSSGLNNVVGQMKVSTSVTLCPKSSEITETQFVLSASTQTSAPVLRKNKGLTKKVADAFRTNQSRKLRTYSSDTVLEHVSEDVIAVDHAQNFMPRNHLELAAIVVKHHICESPKKPQVGGWGLNFLKQTNAGVEDSVSCECSTSMDILLPAGFHGGPRTRAAGAPSSLVERWRSGGSCDCGGWDVGCPLTIINTKQNTTETHSSGGGECKTVDLIVKVTKIFTSF